MTGIIPRMRSRPSEEAADTVGFKKQNGPPGTLEVDSEVDDLESISDKNEDVMVDAECMSSPLGTRFKHLTL